MNLTDDALIDCCRENQEKDREVERLRAELKEANYWRERWSKEVEAYGAQAQERFLEIKSLRAQLEGKTRPWVSTKKRTPADSDSAFDFEVSTDKGSHHVVRVLRWCQGEWMGLDGRPWPFPVTHWRFTQLPDVILEIDRERVLGTANSPQDQE